MHSEVQRRRKIVVCRLFCTAYRYINLSVKNILLEFLNSGRSFPLVSLAEAKKFSRNFFALGNVYAMASVSPIFMGFLTGNLRMLDEEGVLGSRYSRSSMARSESFESNKASITLILTEKFNLFPTWERKKNCWNRECTIPARNRAY